MNNIHEGDFLNIITHNPESVLLDLGIETTRIGNSSSILVVGMGSGALEKLIKKTRNDLFVVSVEPLLGLDGSYSVFNIGGGCAIYQKKGLNYFSPSNFQAVSEGHISQKRKKAIADGLIPVAAFATGLPFSSAAFNLIIDNYGPAHYLEREEEKIAYAKHIRRCLKSGGFFHCDRDSAVSIGEVLVSVGLKREINQEGVTKFIKP